jgi:hypothetical protein
VSEAHDKGPGLPRSESKICPEKAISEFSVGLTAKFPKIFFELKKEFFLYPSLDKREGARSRDMFSSA